MKRARLFAVVLVSIFGATAIACGGGKGGGSSSDGATPAKSSKKGSNADDPGTSPEGDPSQGTPTEPTPGQDAGPPKEGGPGTPPPNGLACKELTACGTTTQLAAVHGDSGGSTVRATGAGSQWFSVRVQKLDFGSAPLSIDVALTSPAGAEYEVHLYEDDCKTEIESPTVQPDGSSDVYSTWTGQGKNVTIEVRYLSGACDPGKKWTLDVTGGL
jgi:hypothetical protein